MALDKSQVAPSDKDQIKKILFTRQLAWCVLLGISHNSGDYKAAETEFLEMKKSAEPESQFDAETLTQVE